MACIQISAEEAKKIRIQLKSIGLKLTDASQLIHRNPNYLSASLSRKSIDQKSYLELLDLLRKNKPVKKASLIADKSADKSEDRDLLKSLINVFIEDQLALLTDLENAINN